MQLILLVLSTLCFVSKGQHFGFNPFFTSGDEGLFDTGVGSLERALHSDKENSAIHGYPFQPVVPPNISPFVGQRHPHLGIRPLFSSRIPIYSDARHPGSFGPRPVSQGQFKEQTKIRHEIPFLSSSRTNLVSLLASTRPPLANRRLPLTYSRPPSPQPTYTRTNAFRPVNGNSGQSSTTYSSSSANSVSGITNSSPHVQTGFIPIFSASGQQKKTNIQKPISLLSTSTDALKSSSSQQISVASLKNTINEPPKSALTLLTAVPAEVLAKARQSNQRTYNSNPTSPLFNSTEFKTIVRSSVSTRVVSSLSPDNSKESSSVQEVKLAAKKVFDIDCDGSSDLGWCDLGKKYPKVLVQKMTVLCKDMVERMHVEIPRSFSDLSDSPLFGAESLNSTQTEAKERGNHESWSWSSYLSQKGSLCDSERGFLRPEAAKDSSGKWNLIVQTEDFKQRVPIEMCRKANDSCKKLADLAVNSKCLQKYTYQLMLSLDPNHIQGCPYMKLYRFPSSCVCHVD